MEKEILLETLRIQKIMGLISEDESQLGPGWGAELIDALTSLKNSGKQISKELEQNLLKFLHKNPLTPAELNDLKLFLNSTDGLAVLSKWRQGVDGLSGTQRTLAEIPFKEFEDLKQSSVGSHLGGGNTPGGGTQGGGNSPGGGSGPGGGGGGGNVGGSSGGAWDWLNKPNPSSSKLTNAELISKMRNEIGTEFMVYENLVDGLKGLTPQEIEMLLLNFKDGKALMSQPAKLVELGKQLRYSEFKGLKRFGYWIMTNPKLAAKRAAGITVLCLVAYGLYRGSKIGYNGIKKVSDAGDKFLDGSEGNSTQDNTDNTQSERPKQGGKLN
jgi:hypothetical protein